MHVLENKKTAAEAAVQMVDLDLESHTNIELQRAHGTRGKGSATGTDTAESAIEWGQAGRRAVRTARCAI